MAKARLANLPVEVIQAEIQRRLSKLPELLKQRDQLNRQIAELGPLAGRAPKAAGPKARATKAKAPAKPVRRRRKRGMFKQTAEQFVLSLFSGGAIKTTAELAAAWNQAGRGGKVDNSLTKLVKAKTLKRRKIRGKKGSKYRLA